MTRPWAPHTPVLSVHTASLLPTLSVLQPLRVKIPEVLQAEIGKLLMGQVAFLVPSVLNSQETPESESLTLDNCPVLGAESIDD